METPVKIRANGVMTKSVLGQIITWTYADGSKLTFDAAKSPQTREQAMMHGYAQKIGDAAAMSADTKTGKPATLAEKKAAMEATITNLYAGEWNSRATSGDSVLFQAVVAHYAGKKSPDAVRTYLAGLKPAEKAKLALMGPIKKQIDRINAELVKASGIDVDAEMAKLDAI